MGTKRWVASASYVDLTNDSEVSIAESIKKLFLDTSVHSRFVVLCVPRHLAIVKHMRLPSVDPSEIQKMAKMEILRQLPYNEEDILDGFKISDQTEDGYSSVLSASILKITIDRFLRIVRQAGLQVQKITLSSESLYLWFLKNVPNASEKIVLFVNIDSDSLDIVVIENGRLAFSRGVLLHLDPSSNAQKIVEDILISIDTYQTQSQKEIHQIYLSDSENKLGDQKDSSLASLKYPLIPVQVSAGVSGDAQALQALQQFSSLSLIGACLEPEKMQINLIPKTFIEEGRTLLLKKNLILLAVLLALIVSSIGVIVGKRSNEKKVLVDLISAEVKKYDPRVNEVKKMIADIETVKKEINASPQSIEVLGQVYQWTPSTIRLNLLDYQEGQFLVLRGTSPSHADVFAYAKSLEKTALFQNVNIRYTNLRSGDSKMGVDFELGLEVPFVESVG